MEPSLPDPRIVRRTFDRVADRYDGHAALEQEVASRLLERLEFHRLAPKRIIDLGCGTGQAGVALSKKFPKAEVIGLDSSYAMLTHLRRKSGIQRRLKAVCTDISALPLPERSSELLFSNLALPWCQDPFSPFAEFRRILAAGGLLLFSSFGPDSLMELRSAFRESDGTTSRLELTDILQLGDALLAAGFREPVMDAERITVSYPDMDSLVRELETTGTSMLLLGKRSLAEAGDHLAKAYEPLRVDGRYPVTYEIVYGTAFGPPEGQPRKTPHGDVTTFSVESLRQSSRDT